MPDSIDPQPSAAHRRVHLAAFVEGVNHTTVWRDPDAGSQIAFESFRHIAGTAERGLFDMVFLGQGLRLREQRGRLFELDVAGRPESLTLFAALAAVTERVGLAATANTTYTSPRDLAEQFAAVDHLTGGRSAWNIVTTDDAFTGANHRSGAYLDHADRYRRAADVVLAAEAAWQADGGAYRYDGELASLAGRSSLPRSPQGRPVYVQAGDSPTGRDFAARMADVVFSLNSDQESALRFAADLEPRLAARGRSRADIRILPITRIALGATTEEAEARALEIGFGQIGPERAIAFAEQVWGTSLDGVDPEGPLPDLEPVVPDHHVMQGRVQSKADPREVVAGWRERADREGHSLRSLMVAVYATPHLIGTPADVARRMVEFVDSGASDGFALGTHLTPGGFDEIVDLVVPELQRLGAYPDAYQGDTLREHLGLPELPFHHPDPFPTPEPTRA